MGEDPIVKELRSNSPIQLVVHVGAHLAEEVWHYESLGAVTVVWVEADPDLFIRLQERLTSLPASETEHLTVCALASSTTGATLTLNRYSNDGASNSVYRSSPNLRRLWPHLSETGSRVDLSTRTLADILGGLGVRLDLYQCSLLVLDVQGHELDVLDGAGMALVGAFTYVCSEVSFEDVYEEAPKGWAVLEWLQGAGFEPVTSLPAIHGDILLRRASGLLGNRG